DLGTAPRRRVRLREAPPQRPFSPPGRATRRGLVSTVVEITQGAPTAGSRLATFIRASRDAIVEDWTVLARQLPSARKIDRTQLLDFVPRLLDRIAGLADALARGESGPDPSDLGARHADQRLASGFELVEIVRELAMLRSCVLARL